MGHVFHLAWYMNGVGFGDSSRTSVPKIMASDPPVALEEIIQAACYGRGLQGKHSLMREL